MAPTTFNVYLVRKGSEPDVMRLLQAPQRLDIPGLTGAQLSVLPSEPHLPSWYTSLAEYLPPDGDRPPPLQLPGALAACWAAGRLLVISFGAAHSQVRKALVEAHFGRRVAMNSVPPTHVIELQARQVFAAFHRLSERAPGATGHRKFGVEGERDLVAAIEGLPRGPTRLGQRIRGATALTIEIEAADLPAALIEAVTKFGQPSPFADWSELDNLTPVSEQGAVDTLDTSLDAFLATRPAGLTLALPGDEASARAALYHVGRMTKSPVLRPILFPAAFYDSISGPPTVAAAKATAVHLFDSDRSPLEERESIYSCICFETSIGDRAYVLWSGRWYEANIDFRARIRKRVASLASPTKALVKWDGASDEAAYNAVAGGRPGLLNLDRKLVQFGGGHSKFEFCDIIHPKSQTLYFVKQYSSSATMSHLVEQVRRTAELFFSRDPGYRRHLTKAGIRLPDAQPRHGDWTLCLVVMGRPFSRLPFFAQCGIGRLVRELERNQHRLAAQAV